MALPTRTGGLPSSTIKRTGTLPARRPLPVAGATQATPVAEEATPVVGTVEVTPAEVAPVVETTPAVEAVAESTPAVEATPEVTPVVEVAPVETIADTTPVAEPEVVAPVVEETPAVETEATAPVETVAEATAPTVVKVVEAKPIVFPAIGEKLPANAFAHLCSKDLSDLLGVEVNDELAFAITNLVAANLVDASRHWNVSLATGLNFRRVFHEKKVYLNPKFKMATPGTPNACKYVLVEGRLQFRLDVVNIELGRSFYVNVADVNDKENTCTKVAEAQISAEL